jgi:hypothetical protein
MPRQQSGNRKQAWIGSRRASGKIRIDFNFIDAVKSSEPVLVRLG